MHMLVKPIVAGLLFVGSNSGVLNVFPYSTVRPIDSVAFPAPDQQSWVVRIASEDFLQNNTVRVAIKQVDIPEWGEAGAVGLYRDVPVTNGYVYLRNLGAPANGKRFQVWVRLASVADDFTTQIAENFASEPGARPLPTEKIIDRSKSRAKVEMPPAVISLPVEAGRAIDPPRFAGFKSRLGPIHATRQKVNFAQEEVIVKSAGSNWRTGRPIVVSMADTGDYAFTGWKQMLVDKNGEVRFRISPLIGVRNLVVRVRDERIDDLDSFSVETVPLTSGFFGK